MQKKLLTVAVAGALAAPGLALAQVEVYGFVNMSFGNFKYSSPTQQGTAVGFGSVSKWDVSSAASNVGFRARENVGGGNTAWMQIETNAGMERSNNIANTSGIASRNSAIGMQGSWGNVFIGQWTTPWADLDALWGVGTVGGFGPVTSIIGRRETTGAAPMTSCANGGSGLGGVGAGTCESVESGGGVGHPFWRRASNSLHYQSPVFGGVQIKVMYQTNQDKTGGNGTSVPANDPQMYSASVAWAGMGGRVRVGAAIDAHKEFTTMNETDNGFRVTGGWNFGFADIGLAYETMTYKSQAGDCDATQYGIAVAIPVGNGAIRASYSIADDIEGNFTGAAAAAGTFGAGSCGAAPTATFNTSNNGAKQYNIGYDYRFSKRTTVGFGYAAIKNDEAAVFTWSGAPQIQVQGSVTPLPGSDPSVFFVNMIHRF